MKTTWKTTWKCHSCGKERDDENISVYTYPIPDIPGAERNWRYCNDNQECLDKAIVQGKTGKV